MVGCSYSEVQVQVVWCYQELLLRTRGWSGGEKEVAEIRDEEEAGRSTHVSTTTRTDPTYTHCTVTSPHTTSCNQTTINRLKPQSSTLTTTYTTRYTNPPDPWSRSPADSTPPHPPTRHPSAV